MVAQVYVSKAHSAVSFTVVGIMLDGNLAVFQSGLIVFQLAMSSSSTRDGNVGFTVVNTK